MSGTRGVVWLCLATLLAGPCGPLGTGVARAEPLRDPHARDARLRSASDPAPPETAPAPAPRERAYVPVILAAGGLVAGLALAVVLKNDADDLYEQYLRTADPEQQEDLFARAERMDRWSLVGWVVAQASLVLFFFALIREGEKPLVPTDGPVALTASPDGTGLGLRITP